MRETQCKLSQCKVKGFKMEALMIAEKEISKKYERKFYELWENYYHEKLKMEKEIREEYDKLYKGR